MNFEISQLGIESMNFVICIAGKNEIAVNSLLYLIKIGYKDRVVVCPNRTDTGNSNWQPSLIRFANEYGVPIVTAEDLKKIKNLVFISLEYDRIIKPNEFASRRLFNLHFSILPAFKGMYTSAVPILDGALQSGVTLHEIDYGIDTGNIIAQKIFDLPTDCTARDLYFLYQEHGFSLFKEELTKLLHEQPPHSYPQSAIGSSYISKSFIDYSNLRIDLRQTADRIIKQFRAFSFREYQIPVVHGVAIGSWGLSRSRSVGAPGKLEKIQDDKYRLATIDYDLIVHRSRDFEWFEWLSYESPTNGLPQDNKFIDCTDKNGWSPLMRAAYSADYERCLLLLESGARPNQSNCNGTTPLMFASSSPNVDGKRKTIDALLHFGADLDLKDRFNKKITDYRSLY